MILATLFDYDVLDMETRIVVQQKTGEIKDRIKRTRQDIIEIGERLIEVKGRLGHGRFGEWLKTEFDWAERTAHNFMNVAEAFKSAIIADLDIAPTALYSLSAPSVPEEARKEAIERAKNGDYIGSKEAKEIKEKHKPAPKQPDPSLLSDSEEDERERQRIEAGPPDLDDEPRVQTRPPEQKIPEPQARPSRPFTLTPTPTTDIEVSSEAWVKLFTDVAHLVQSIDRRGGIKQLAARWSKSSIEDNIDSCDYILETFAGYKVTLEEMIK